MTQIATTAGPRRAEIGTWISQGLDWFAQDWPTQLVIGFFAVVLLSVSSGLLGGPVFAGLALSSLKKAQTGEVRIAHFFDGFRYIIWSSLAYFLILLLGTAGLFFFVVPGLVILGMYAFSFHFLVDQDQDFWQGMESSRQFVGNDYFGFTLFGLLLCVVNVLGFFFVGIGVLVSLPITALALAAAFVSEGEEPGPSDSLRLSEGPVVIE